MDEKPAVRTRGELIGVIFQLLDDHDACGNQWKANDIYAFLQYTAEWLDRCETDEASWQLFADALCAASEWKHPSDA